ncbi:MAG TPA: hypothetical protein VG456_06895 [Candidatus Sulfopaludibacter sp.]|jgi:uncharacterized protein (TIGR03437 family)|nr:hypothetical protein [Candidatus Sulfopaludibacter sp.]
MTRVFLLFTVFCFSLRAQFDNLATTDDGSTLLFQSTWRLSGSNDTNLLKIFRWDGKGFSLVFSPPNPGQAEAPYESGPFLSGDGKISGFVVYPGCTGVACSTVKPTLVLNGATAPATISLAAPVQISRNGRFLAAGTTLVDLTTGSVSQISPGDIVASARALGNNGGLLTLTLHQAFIVHSVDLKLSTSPGLVIVTAPVLLSAALSAVENRVIYEIWSDPSASHDQLWSYDVATGQSTKLAEVPLENSVGISQFQPSISNDGSRLLFRRQRSDGVWEAVVQDFTAGTATVVARILPSSSNLVISGDGKSAWVHRSDGKLVRVAIDSLQANEAPGRHAWISLQEGGQVPGSYHHLYGGGFALDAKSGPAPDLSLDLQGLSVPLVSANTGELDVQIPWDSIPSSEFPAFPLTLRNSSSPFESVVQLDLETAAPTFERTGNPLSGQRTIILAHQDFHGAVTLADPATPGELVHAYMTGLGQVQPTPPNGSAPTSLSYVSIQPLCWVQPPGAPQETAPIAFAGLAPGLIGLYQVDIQIPADIKGTQPTLSCVDQFSAVGVIGDSGTLFLTAH